MIEFTLNGRKVRSVSPPIARLADVLRDELGLTGTKIGCNAGDCGACTVLLDGKQVCSCLTALGQVAHRRVVTVEGLANQGRLSDLQIAFQKHGAAQCGVCSPGMLMAASDLLQRVPQPNAGQVKDALTLAPKLIPERTRSNCSEKYACAHSIASTGWPSTQRAFTPSTSSSPHPPPSPMLM